MTVYFIETHSGNLIARLPMEAPPRVGEFVLVPQGEKDLQIHKVEKVTWELALDLKSCSLVVELAFLRLR